MAERGYLEGNEDGQRLQHAALERPDLAVRHQQLPARQGADAVRPAVLEFRRDADAGGQPLVLSAPLLSRQHAVARARWTIGNVKLDLGKVKVPIYNLATREDHIAPAKSAFLGSKFFGGPVKFVLAGSGHIAGVVNPPGKAEVPVLDRRQGRHRHARRLAEEGEGASRLVVAGLDRLDQVARTPTRCRRASPAAASSKPIEDAPGRYVKVKA